MKKIKELWKNNRIIFTLVCILLICLIAIAVVAFSFFFAGGGSSYGERLVGIEKYPISEELKAEYLQLLKDNKLVKDASLSATGRVIYITISFANDTSLDEAKSVATLSLDKFSDDYLKYYDYDFIMSCNASDSSDGFSIFGAHNANGTGVIWNNNTQEESGS